MPMRSKQARPCSAAGVLPALCAVLCLALVLAGCGRAATDGAPTPQPAGSTASGSPAPTSPAPSPSFSTPAPSPGAALTPRQLAGQRVVYSYKGLTPPPRLLAAIRAGEAAGVVFFGQNISSAQQIRTVVGQLQAAAAQSPVKTPLLMMTDQEGGLVRRLPGPPALSEKQVGAAADPVAAARQAGHDAAMTLREAGMNVDLAPVLDVYRSPGDFIDELGRSYSSDPDVVAELGATFIAALQGQDVAATAKHFPGLGAAGAGKDTDKRPVELSVPLAELRAVDEAPYPAAVAAGVRLIMVSWATYPALDASRPAGLSPTVAGDELRRRLSFQGVTVTDALGANALRPFGDEPQRGVLAAGAGMDLLLCAGKRADEGTSVVDALSAALQSGALDRSDFLASVRRVEALRASLPR
jgi:beta-N-acetylhexosaminidase